MSRSRLLGILLAGALSVLPAAAAHADTNIKSANSSEGTDTSSGDATATNNGAAQVGHAGGSSQVGDNSADASGASGGGAADINNADAANVQEGDNELEASQDATATSGSSIGGQLIGAVTDGTLTVDATNLSSDVDAETGDADANNGFAAFVGLSAATNTAIGADDIRNTDATNVQAGDNTSDLMQNTDAASGDAIAGQVFGGRSGGPADVVLANASEDSDTTSGDADESSDASTADGLFASGEIDI